MGRPRSGKLTPQQRVERNIDWIERYCRVPEGPQVGQPVVLREFQKDWIRLIYGNPAGTRRAIISVGRKNAKTSFAAFLLLLHLAGWESRPNAKLYSTAQSKEQAGLLFELAAQMVRASAELRGCIVVRRAQKELECPERGTKYRALSADVPTVYGLSPAFIVHDELRSVKGPKSDLYDAMESATGAHAEPLSVIISTQAPTDVDLLSTLIDDAQKGADPRIVCTVMTAPIDADPFAEETIRQANPAFGDFLNAVEVMSQAESARRLPSAEASFRNLILNQRVEVADPFISKKDWQTCGGEIAKDFDQLPAFGGLDLSAANDLTAFVRVAKSGDAWSVKSTFWLPQDGLIERARKDKVDYDVWWRNGLLETTPGRAIEYDYVARYVINVLQTTKLKKIAFDPWNFVHFKAALVRQGMSEKNIENTFVEFRQGFKSMTPALRALEALILDGKLHHANHPVLAMCAHNAVITLDPAGSRKLDKAKARGRIDGIVALAMATDIALQTQQQGAREYKILVV